MNGSKYIAEVAESFKIGRRALYGRHEAYRKERCRLIQAIMPE